jgi:hypothetical protein
MSGDYASDLEERGARLWGLISQLEGKRVVHLETFALTGDDEEREAAEKLAARISAAEEALSVMEGAINEERRSNV